MEAHTVHWCGLNNEKVNYFMSCLAYATKCAARVRGNKDITANLERNLKPSGLRTVKHFQEIANALYLLATWYTSIVWKIDILAHQDAESTRWSASDQPVARCWDMEGTTIGRASIAPNSQTEGLDPDRGLWKRYVLLLVYVPEYTVPYVKHSACFRWTLLHRQMPTVRFNNRNKHRVVLNYKICLCPLRNQSGHQRKVALAEERRSRVSIVGQFRHMTYDLSLRTVQASKQGPR